MKINKAFKIMLSAILLFTFIASPVKANENVVLDLLTFKIETNYKIDDVEVVYDEDIESNKYSVSVIEKETGLVLESYSEKPSIPLAQVKALNDGTILTKASSTYTTTLDTTQVITRHENYVIEVYAWAQVEVTADFSWRQVNKVISCGHMAGGSGPYTISAANTYVANTTFPVTNTLRLGINGVVESSKTTGGSFGWSFNIFKEMGFTMTGSTSTNWYARKSYNTIVSIIVMR